MVKHTEILKKMHLSNKCDNYLTLKVSNTQLSFYFVGPYTSKYSNILVAHHLFKLPFYMDTGTIGKGDIRPKMTYLPTSSAKSKTLVNSSN